MCQKELIMEKNTLQKFEILALLHEFNQHELQLTVYRNTDIHFLHEVLQILEEITEFIEKQNDVFSLNDILSVERIRELYIHKANIYLHFNTYEKALEAYQKAKSYISKEEKDDKLHWLKCMDGISWVKARMELYEDALKDCNELISYAFQKDALLPKFFTVRACCYKELGQTLLSERDFEIAKCNPLQVKMVLQKLGDYSLPNGFTVEGYMGIGNRAFALGFIREALLMYENAIVKEPTNAQLYFGKGVILSKMQHHNDAIQAYTNCLQFDAYMTDAYVNRGNEYSQLRIWNLALQDYQDALKIDPHNEMAKHNICELNK